MFDFDKLTNRYNTYSEKYDCREDILPMWVADMDFDTAPAIKDAIINRLNQGALGYSYVSDDLKDSYINFWKRHHDTVFSKDEMIFSTGVVASISSIVRSLTNISENVLIMSPVYNIFYNSIINNGRKVLSSDLVYEDGKYHIDFNDLEEKLKDPQTTLMILCNPHNPVGKVWTKSDLERIGHLAYVNNVVVLSDEIHCDIVRDGKSYTSFLSLNEECRNNCVVTIAPSKCFNIAGLNSSMIVVPNKKLYHKVWRGLNTDECAEPNAFANTATIAALNDCDEWLKCLNLYLDENIKIFNDFIKKELPYLSVIKADATYLLWVDCSKITDDTTSLCSFIKEKAGLWITSGAVYGKNGKSFFRINIGTQRSNLLEGLKRLKKGIEEYKKRNS